MRAAIYARYSSEQQSAVSLPDQVRICSRLSAEQGWTVAQVFADEAMSGASHLHASMKGKMDALETDKAELEALLQSTTEPDPVTLHPGPAEIYSRKVANLSDALNDAATRAEAADLLRGLIDKIYFHPEAGAPGGHTVELFGELGAILCNRPA